MTAWSVGSVSGAQAVSPASWSGASRRMGGPGATDRMKAAVTAVAQLLGTQPSTLVSQLGSGQSLTSVAAAQGVSRQSVLDAVAKAVSTAGPQGREPLSGDLLATVTSRISDTTSVPRGFSLRPTR